MGQRAKIARLPEALRKELDAKLISSAFSDHDELSAWLEGNGFQISRGSVQRYSSELQRRIEQVRSATLSAEALIEASPDDVGSLSDASMRLIQQRIYNFMLAAEDNDPREMANTARALADVARAGRSIREERRKIIKQIAQETAKAANESNGYSIPSAALKRIREQVYGIFEEEE